MATWMGFEPTTSAVTGRHSNQLNYQASSTFYYWLIKCNEQYLITSGGSNRARTCDPLLVRQMLSQLSYTSKNRTFCKSSDFVLRYFAPVGRASSKSRSGLSSMSRTGLLVTPPGFEPGIPP